MCAAESALEPTSPASYQRSLPSGIGLVVASMIGTGVLTTSGFLVADLSPGWVLAAWLVGGAIALVGARAYAALAEAVPGSGGEYRYLTTLLHPAAGWLAGWTSLLVGFAAPVAMGSLAAGAWLAVLLPVDPLVAGLAVLAGVTGLHALHLQVSSRAQDVLVLLKFVLLLAFCVLGLVGGQTTLPADLSQGAAAAGGPSAFSSALVAVGFCYSGWNAAAYVAEEFRQPRRDVPRAMLIGCGLVVLLYLVVNFVLLANLTPADLSQARGDAARLTLAHVVAARLAGPMAAGAMTAVVLVALLSSLSAMTIVGPRVYAAMARDGLLPRRLAGRPDAPPVGAVLLQSGVAGLLILTHDFRMLLDGAGALLSLTSAVAAGALLLRPGKPAIRAVVVAYVVTSLAALVGSVAGAPGSLLWMGTVLGVAAGGWWVRQRWAPTLTPADARGAP